MKKIIAVMAILRLTILRYFQKKTWRLAASISFYALFAIAPLWFLIITFGEQLFERTWLVEQFLEQVSIIIGSEARTSIQTIINNFEIPDPGFWGYAGIIISFLFGAFNAVDQLRESINKIWQFPRFFKNRSQIKTKGILYLTVLPLFTLLIFISLATSWLINILITAVGPLISFKILLFRVGDLASSWIIIFIASILIYKYLPDRDAGWKNVMAGSVLTALMFSILKLFLSYSFMYKNIQSMYGVISATFAFLILVYLSAQVILLGASFIGSLSEKQIQSSS
ncbi:MAG: hypothetical protein GF384_03030 [Elusimicrobia bacterium]|nr:hypothetical protein [Elusimicrobiota bacterium]MBD3411910.1 hypothetical protein [Elusimicrobiota bacterium]